jgi:hypothetical protein
VAHTDVAHIGIDWQLSEVIKCVFGVGEGDSSFVVFFDDFGDGS